MLGVLKRRWKPKRYAGKVDFFLVKNIFLVSALVAATPAGFFRKNRPSFLEIINVKTFPQD